ncbi:MAG TPA: hypothetical protein VL309_10925, partial [Vicinamibacterales bacterium]|nr:hypothetical protein [Vicinamibacterales bacterium]
DRGRRLPARVELTALGDDDSTVFEGAVMPTSAGAVDDDEGRPVRAVFEAPPGALRLRMSIEDSASRVIDHDVREISLRDLKGPVVMSTPEVFRTRNAREFRALAADAAAAPVASREFSRTERLLIRVRAYAASGARPAISATLENRLGQTMRDLTVTPATTADRPDQIDLPLAPFASGEYHLALKAHAPDGETRDVVTFRITS